MKQSLIVALAASAMLAFAGCGGGDDEEPPMPDSGTVVADGGEKTDAGHAVTDAGETDAGPIYVDAGEEEDAGAPDAGPIVTDAGETDAGPIYVDAGEEEDAGPIVTDAGETDAGLIPVDAGWLRPDAGEEDAGASDPCEGVSCGDHASCSSLTGAAVCACDSGYQDKDNDGICKPNCNTAGLSGCSGHGNCSASSGTATCTCKEGYAGVKCSECDTANGYEKIADGTCAIVAPPPVNCQSNTCNGHGTCSVVSGAVKCGCDDGYAGDFCQSCATGYQDGNGDGTCLPTCQTAGLNCGSHGACAISSAGAPACECAAGYAGDDCGSCAKNYQDNDHDGLCKPNCTAAGLTGCSGHGSCSATSGTATCTCKEGYAGVKCAECADGYDKDSTGACVAQSSGAQEWTFMVYLDGDNNLSDAADADLQEMVDGMKAAGAASDKVNVVVLYDGNGASDSVVYQVNKSGKTKISNVSEVFSGKEARMNEAETLKKFGVWAVKSYPAKRYALVMWDHGGGWRDGESGEGGLKARSGSHCGSHFSLAADGKGSPLAPAFRDFAQDEHSMDSESMITLADGAYGTALDAIVKQAGKKLALAGFDACLMGMYETAAATRNYADYLVASSETEPGDGWNYEKILTKLGKSPSMDAKTLGTTIADAYADTPLVYEGGDYYVNATMAVYDLSTMDILETRLSELVQALMDDDVMPLDTLYAIARDTQRFEYGEHADLMDLAKRIRDSSQRTSRTGDAAKALIAALEKTIVYHRSQSCLDYWEYRHDNANGMAIFFPLAYNCCFDGASLSVISTWDEYDECPNFPYSSFVCEDSRGDAGYNILDILYFEETESTYEYTGAYIQGPWNEDWKDFLLSYSASLFED